MRRLYPLSIIAFSLGLLLLGLKMAGPCVFGACDATRSFTDFVTGGADREEGRGPLLPAERVSAAGTYYGQCAGTILAVVLLPEPCGWQEQAFDIAVR